MKILLYNRLNTEPVQRQFDKTLNYLQQGDFRSADVRKMKTQGFYRARLDDTNRLLFQIGEYEGKKYLFILEVILNHDYAKSRFLRGGVVQEEKLKPIYDLKAVPKEEVMEMPYLNSNSTSFTILSKVITFDDKQTETLFHEPPMLLLGAAGCGKTVLALEKLRQYKGQLLYVTLSDALAEGAKKIYHKDQAPIEGQEVSFCSLDFFLRMYLTPKTREASFDDFKVWFERIRSTVRIKDSHKLFEEIRGVLTGSFLKDGPITLEEYEQLGIRQSVFPVAERKEVYAIYMRYINWLKTENLYDPNIFANFAYPHIQPDFDMIVVDEVQDMTTMQLSAVLKSLKHENQFILSGDANQVVHPNFFSWTSVKRLLHQRHLNRDIIRLLPGNYRNDEKIVKMANKVLALKNVRFGSIDKESSTTIDTKALPESDEEAVQFFEENNAVLNHLNQAFSISSQVAIIVLRDEDKAEAKKHFKTPLIFSVHEAKGLEFHFVILYNFINSNSGQFASICEGVAPRDLTGELQYSRPKDKEDRSLQSYQFYINSLYVAITRAKKFLFVVEKEHHRLFTLLGARSLKKKVGNDTPMPMTTLADWQRSADDLEKFGRKEQAAAIRAKLGKSVPVPWHVINYQEYIEIRDKYLFLLADKSSVPKFNNREINKLYQHLLFYPDLIGMVGLLEKGKNRLMQLWKESSVYLKKILTPYQPDKLQRIEPIIKKYGPNHRNEIGLTPLMIATMAGAYNVVKYLLMAGADPNVTDNWGRTAFHLAIMRAYKDEGYATKHLQKMAQLVIPPLFHHKSSDHSVGIPNTDFSFYIASIIIALQLEFYWMKREKEHVAFHLEDFCKILKNLLTDEQAIKWGKREYITAYLSESDVNKHKRPFLIKLRKGYYTIMLAYQIQVCDEWMMFQELYDIEKLGLFQNDPGMLAFQTDMQKWALEAKAFVRTHEMKELMAEEEAFSATLPDDDLRDWPV